MDGTSSQAASNWVNIYVPVIRTTRRLTRSNFDPGHRITVSGGYDIPMGAGFTVTASVFYSGQSGRPWSAIFNVRLQRRCSRHERPALHPGQRERSDRFTNGTAPRTSMTMTFINEHVLPVGLHRQNARAQRVPVAVDRTRMDSALNVGLPFKRVKAEDHLGSCSTCMNLFDSQKGLFEYANFNDLLVVRADITGRGSDQLQPANIYHQRCGADAARTVRCATTCSRGGRCSWGEESGSRAGSKVLGF